MLSTLHQHGGRADGNEHGDHRQEPAGEVAVAEDDERAYQEQRHDGELGTVGGDVVEQADTDDRQSAGRGRRLSR